MAAHHAHLAHKQCLRTYKQASLGTLGTWGTSLRSFTRSFCLRTRFRAHGEEEVEAALEKERRQNKLVLFPIRLAIRRQVQRESDLSGLAMCSYHLF
jgi:hypothetical protein